MRRLIARLVSPRVRTLEADLERVDRLAMAEVRRMRAQLDEARCRLDAVREQAAATRAALEAERARTGCTGCDVDWWRREALQLRRTCSLMGEQLAAYEGRTARHRLPPTRLRRTTDALTEIIRQVPGDATAVLDPDRTAVIPRMRTGGPGA